MSRLSMSVGADAQVGHHGGHVQVQRRGDRWFLRVLDQDRALLDISLGLEGDGVDLVTQSDLVATEDEGVVRERFWLSSGKRAGWHDAVHREHTFTFSHDTCEWGLVVRTAADGVALRYWVPARAGVLGRADAGFDLPVGTRVWFEHYQTWYENEYAGAAAEEADGLDVGCPLLARLEDSQYVLVTESDMDEHSTGSHLCARMVGSSVHWAFVPADAALEVPPGTVTPWRVFLLGSLARIVESSFVDELARPAAHPQPGWVRPGPATWSWWSDHYSGSQEEAQRRFVDFAVEMGWRNLLIDCGWVEDWIPSIVAYAAARGVGVHLWCRWTDLATSEQRRCLGRWASWGVAGVKVDFMESEDNARYRWYADVLAETQRVGLMLNVHGSVIPRGWSRTWPHLLSYEAVRANEYSTFYGKALPPAHNVILPFTRNVLGAMDFTPVAFGTDLRSTSDGHELGTVIAFECGLTHLADDPDAYRARPAAVRLLRGLPDTWTRTVLLTGDPDSHAVIARHDGTRWFIGGVAVGTPRLLTVPLTPLGPVSRCWVVTDSPAGLTATDVPVVDGILQVQLAANGGFAAVTGGPPPPRPQAGTVTPPVPAPDVLLDADGTVGLVLDEAMEVAAEPQWRRERAEGRWVVTAPDGLRPGGSGVITIRHPSGGIAHVRAHRRLTPGEHALSSLAFRAFTNFFGPVERDQSNGGGNPDDGQPIRIAGARFESGLGVAAPSRVAFFLGGQAERLYAAVGVDDETPQTSAKVTVELDGVVAWSATVTSGVAPIPVEVSARDAETLVLIAEPADPIHSEAPHVDWAAARVVVKTGRAAGRPAHQKEGQP